MASQYKSVRRRHNPRPLSKKHTESLKQRGAQALDELRSRLKEVKKIEWTDSNTALIVARAFESPDAADTPLDTPGASFDYVESLDSDEVEVTLTLSYSFSPLQWKHRSKFIWTTLLLTLFMICLYLRPQWFKFATAPRS
jgi:hypothetical protein